MASLAQLRALLRSTAPALKTEQVTVSTGITALDRLLPEGGFKPGSMVEWLSDAAAGSATLAYHAIPSVLSNGRIWCVVDPQHTFCPTPLFSRPEGPPCLVVRPKNWADTCWTMEQVLRCEGIAATWLWTGEAVSDRVLRRWKLAVEQGGGLGMLFRPLSAARQPSWADVRWRVVSRFVSRSLLSDRDTDALQRWIAPVSRSLGSDRDTLRDSARRRWRVELVSCKGCFAQGRADLEQDHATGRVHLAAELAHPAAAVGA